MGGETVLPFQGPVLSSQVCSCPVRLYLAPFFVLASWLTHAHGDARGKNIPLDSAKGQQEEAKSSVERDAQPVSHRLPACPCVSVHAFTQREMGGLPYCGSLAPA